MEGESKASAAGKVERHFGIPLQRKQDTTTVFCLSFIFLLLSFVSHSSGRLEEQTHTGTHVQMHHMMVSTKVG